MNAPGDQIAKLRDLSVLRQSRKLHFLRAAVVGIGAGCVAISFRYSIDLVATALASLSELIGPHIIQVLVGVLVCSVLGVIGGALTQRFAPEAGGSGIPHVKAVLLRLRTFHAPRLIPVKFLGGALAIGSGFSLGREGPTVHLGAAVADGIGKLLKVPAHSRNHLIACGAGAGLAAAFNAPLAGFLFVIEELRRELSPITYGAAFIAAVMADGVTRFLYGTTPSLHLSIYSAPSLSFLPVILLIGLVVGAGGILFSRTLLISLRVAPKGIALWKRGATVGAIVGIAAVGIPYSTSNLQELIDHFLLAESGAAMVMWVFGAYFVLKYALTIVSYFSGLPGGIFAPMLAQGALLGIFSGRLCASVFPSLTLADGIYGIIGMSAFFASSVRAPLTGVVLIAEMTNNFNLLFLLLVASLMAYLLAELLGGKPIYEALMELELRKNPNTEEAPTEPMLIDIVIEPQSEMAGIRVRDLRLPKGFLMITVRQQGRDMVPNGDTVIGEGDQICFLVDGDASSQLVTLREAASAPAS